VAVLELGLADLIKIDAYYNNKHQKYRKETTLLSVSIVGE